jgi:hypothetical protein
MKAISSVKCHLPGLVVSLLVFFACGLSAFYLRRVHALDQENIIFDADPYFRSFAFAEGWGERSLMHPNLSNYVNPVVRVSERLVRPVVTGVTPSELRMRLSLMISPFFAASTTLLVFCLGRQAEIGTAKAVSLAAIFGFSMSTIAFGSVPDHFMISAFLCALGIVLFLIRSCLSSQLRFVLWTSLATVAAGITLSNAVPVLALFGLSEWLMKYSWKDVAKRLCYSGVAACLLTVSTWAALNWVYGDFSSLREDQVYKRHVGRVILYITDNPVRDFLSFPITLGRAFWAGAPDVDKNLPYPNPEIARYEIAFGYQPALKQSPLRSLLQLIPFILIVWSLGTELRRRRGASLPVAIGTMVFLLFNWLLHSVWGGSVEMFLFSPHWHFASVLGLVPLASRCSSRSSNVAFMGVAAGISALNLMVWYDVMNLLPSLVRQ